MINDAASGLLATRAGVQDVRRTDKNGLDHPSAYRTTCEVKCK